MKNRMNKQPSDMPPQSVQPAGFTDQQSIEEVARLLSLRRFPHFQATKNIILRMTHIQKTTIDFYVSI